jgi:serine/threonine kinase 16
VQDTATSEVFALKKIRCPFGAESVSQAMREVEAYRIFSHVPTIISSIDYAIATERGADEAAKTVYVLLPYYSRGNLQDMINANLVNRTTFPPRKLMLLFLGVCKALKAMHQYKGPPLGMERMQMGDEDDEAGVENGGAGKKRRKKSKSGKRVASAAAAVPDEEDETEQQRPLMEGESTMGSGETRSYSHRDIKPGKLPFDSSTPPPTTASIPQAPPRQVVKIY